MIEDHQVDCLICGRPMRRTIRELADGFCTENGITLETLLAKSSIRPIPAIRRQFIREAVSAGKSKSSVARFLGFGTSSIQYAFERKD